MTPSGQRERLLAAYDFSGANWSSICACAPAQTRSVAKRRRERFISLRINSPISPFNPSLESAGDVDDVAEAGQLQELGRQRAVRVAVAVHDHGVVLIRQELRQLPLDRIERRAQRSRDVPLGAAIVRQRADVEDHHLPRVEDHFVGDGGSDFGVAAGGRRNADGLAGEKQKAEGRKQKCSLHKISNSNSALTSPTTAPA